MINKVFVNAPERCGSNYLCRFLQENFGFFYVPPVHFLKYIKTLVSADKKQHPHIHHLFCKRLETFSLITESKLYADFVAQDQAIDSLINFYFDQLFQSSVGHIPIFKENELCTYFPLISPTLSNAAIVSQLRDPRMMHRSAKEIRPGFLKSKFGSVNQTIRTWQEAEQSIRFLEVSTQPSKHFYISYENLVSQPEKVITQLDDLPRDTFPFDRDDHVKRMAKISATSSARKNLNSDTFHARLFNTSKLNFADKHISCQLKQQMDRRGYKSENVSKLYTNILATIFLIREPLERIRNKWIHVPAKDGSKALYDPSKI
ncbi:sulfotransferase [Octadecabacter sp.]|nr:sulfotransferase [Octadecabacter sp.]